MNPNDQQAALKALKRYRPVTYRNGNCRGGVGAKMTDAPDNRGSDWRGEDSREWVKLSDVIALLQSSVGAAADAERVEGDDARFFRWLEVYPNLYTAAHFLKGGQYVTLREACESLVPVRVPTLTQAGGRWETIWCKKASELLPPWQWNRVNDAVIAAIGEGKGGAG